MERNKLHILLLAGGEGKRLWPLSNQTKPKALISLPKQKTFLETTLERAQALGLSDSYFISCREKDLSTFQKLLHEHLSHIRFIVEPEGKNTAPPILTTALLLKEDHRPLLILPIDHALEDEREFKTTILSLMARVEDRIIIFGHKPISASEHYGYIQCSLAENGLYPVQSFMEKPPKELAEELIKKESIFWNMGMLLTKPCTLLNEGYQYCPTIIKLIIESVPLPQGNCYHLKPHPWDEIEPISFDRAILEKTNKCFVQTILSRWQDLGTWKEFFLHIPEDEHHNRQVGPVTIRGASGTSVYSPTIPIIIDGVENLLVIASPEGIFVKKS